jgi:tRNA dimethylallyltransferase
LGRGGAIRTPDHLHPIQVRYQTALRPDVNAIVPRPQTGFNRPNRLAKGPSRLGIMLGTSLDSKVTTLNAEQPGCPPIVGKLVAIVGPTAVGKSALALGLAEVARDRFGTVAEIVSADSRQVYRGLDVGTAKPTVAEQRQVTHHLIDVVDPADDFSLAEFQDRAYLAIDDIQRRNRLPLFVGGTGLYVRAVVEGAQLPRVAPDSELRRELEAFADRHGPSALQRRLAEQDPLAAQRIDPRNVRRIIRAIEVTIKTGRPFSEGSVAQPRYQVLTIGLTAERTTLYERIDQRVDRQVANGLVDETRRALAAVGTPNRPAFQGFGYREIVEYLNGEIDLATAIERYKFATHRFVRQQYSWFRLTDPRIIWLEAEREASLARCSDLVARFLEPRAAAVQEVLA